MLRSMQDLNGYTVEATDGDIGTVVDFLLDDRRWFVRSLVVETGRFLTRKQVLISPPSFGDPDGRTRHFHLALTREQVSTSPDVDLSQPVSFGHEEPLQRLDGAPDTSGVYGVWEQGDLERLGGKPDAPLPVDEPRLRSANDLRGYRIQGADRSVGSIEDLIVDDGTWALSYLVVNTSDWGLSKKVLIAPHWTTRVSSTERVVQLDMLSDQIRRSPVWEASDGVNREYETRLYDYYGRPKRWEELPHVPHPQGPLPGDSSPE